VNILEVIQSPVVTERSTLIKEKNNQYVFKVHPDSSKGQIKESVEKIFKVNVTKVRTANFFGKLRRLAMGRPQGRRPDWKKAIVTIQKGQAIKIEAEAPK